MVSDITGTLRVQGDIEVQGNNVDPTIGDVRVNGKITTIGDVEILEGELLVRSADCAEEFDISAGSAQYAAPGTVMVLDDAGGVRVSERDYDSRVVGVVSGAGSYKPAMTLDHQGPSENRLPLALMGKVYCKVDATVVPVAIGDLLTTSFTPGHAMKADDKSRAFGTVIGKSLEGCDGGRALIAILVALQ